MFVDMTAGKIKGFLLMGQNPAVGGQNARFQRKALAKLDWMVVRDFFETETAAFWRNSPEIRSGSSIFRDKDRGVLPPRRRRRGDGRDFHEHAAADPGARQGGRSARRRPKRLLVQLPSGQAAQGALQGFDKRPRLGDPEPVVNYEPEAAEAAEWRIKDEPSAYKLLKEINGYTWRTGSRFPRSPT